MQKASSQAADFNDYVVILNNQGEIRTLTSLWTNPPSTFSLANWRYQGTSAESSPLV